MRSRNNLVLGSNGYIGRHIVRHLMEAGQQVYCSDRHDRPKDSHKKYIKAEVNNLKPLTHYIKKCSVIYFFSGKTGPLDSMNKYDDFINVNEIGLLNLLDLVKKINPKAKLIFPSTRLVYKGKKNLPLKEDSSKEFKTIYAFNKYAGEQYLKMYYNLYGMPFTIFRMSIIYGNEIDKELTRSTKGSPFINHFMNKSQKNENLFIYGKGSQRRSLIHISDLVNIIIKAANNTNSVGKIYNIGGSDNLSVNTIAKIIAKKHNVGVKNIPWPSELLTIESGDTIFDSSKVLNLTKYKYKYNFRGWSSNINP